MDHERIKKEIENIQNVLIPNEDQRDSKYDKSIIELNEQIEKDSEIKKDEQKLHQLRAVLQSKKEKGDKKKKEFSALLIKAQQNGVNIGNLPHRLSSDKSRNRTTSLSSSTSTTTSSSTSTNSMQISSNGDNNHNNNNKQNDNTNEYYVGTLDPSDMMTMADDDDHDDVYNEKSPKPKASTSRSGFESDSSSSSDDDDDDDDDFDNVQPKTKKYWSSKRAQNLMKTSKYKSRKFKKIFTEKNDFGKMRKKLTETYGDLGYEKHDIVKTWLHKLLTHFTFLTSSRRAQIEAQLEIDDDGTVQLKKAKEKQTADNEKLVIAAANNNHYNSPKNKKKRRNMFENENPSKKQRID